MIMHIRSKSKRIALAVFLALNLAPSSWALPTGEAATTAPTSSATSSQPAVDPGGAAQPGATATAAASPIAAELEELRTSLQTQAQQFEEHSKELDAERTALHEELDRLSALEAKLGITADPVAASEMSAAIAPSVTPGAVSADPAQQQDLTKRLEILEDKVKGFGPFTFSGDLRLRDEPYFGGPINDSQVRNRERYRARFNINARLNNDLNGGLTLATGDVNDPITNNQTANQDFTRKPFYLDKAFINYNPHQVKALTLIGGKFGYPWYRTELTWDNDISPEGVSEKLEWKSDTWHVLRQFALIGFQLPFGESSKTNPVTTFTANPPNALLPYPNNSIKQSVVYGGQIQTRWQLASWLSFTADTAFYNWHNADQIALANQVAYGVAAESGPSVGLLKLNNTLTNSYQITTESFVVPVSTTNGAPCVVGTPTGNTCTATVNSYIVGAKFNSKFAETDTIAQFDIKTPSDRWPIRLLADYVQNTEACGNNPSAPPLSPTQLATLPVDATVVNGGTSGSGLKNGACDSHYRRGNWLEGRFGRQQDKGDWQFAYTHMLIEREAVISIFDFSDIRQGTDVQQNRVEAFYQVNRNVNFGFTGFIGRPLHPVVTTPAERYLTRLQFDVMYKF
jgi:Putative porin